MPGTEVWTIGRLLTWTADYLRQHGSDTARLDAELLLAEACGCQRIDLYTRFGDEPAEPARKAFRELVRRRAEGAPVAHLLGRREFYSLNFRVTPDVLIPRPETEFLLIRLLDLAQGLPTGRPLRIVDVGTGSGILAICAARELPAAQITAVDRSAPALVVARANAADHAVQDRIRFVEGDLLMDFPPQRQFEFVVSNPPYIKTAELAELARDVRDFEPRQALEAGPLGTEVIERLIPQAAERLAPGGWLLLEISPQLESDVCRLISGHGGFEPPAVSKDLAGLARVIEAQRLP